jgi:hypothetical protein
MNLKTIEVKKCADCPFSAFNEIVGFYECINPKYSIDDIDKEARTDNIHKDCGLNRTAIMVKLSEHARRRIKEENNSSRIREQSFEIGELGVE